MPDLPIAPDLSGDVPICVRECPSRRLREPGLTPTCHLTGETSWTGTPCIPHVRHLKVLSERRCDGCANWHPEYMRNPGTRGYCEMKDCHPDASDGCRNDWEPRE